MSSSENKDKSETTDIFENLFNPNIDIETLYYPFAESNTIRVQVFSDKETIQETIKLENIFPFFTIDDVKLEIYTHFNNNIKYAPSFQFLGIPYDKDGNEITDENIPGAFYDAIDYTFTKKGNPEVLHLRNPYKSFTSKWDYRFVDAGGNRDPLLQSNPRSRVTLEDAFLKPRKGEMPVLHLFLYSNLYEKLPIELKADEIAQTQYDARIFNYFPDVSKKSKGLSLDSKKLANVNQWVEYHTIFKEILTNNIEPVIADYYITKSPTIQEINLLQFLWLEKTKDKTLDTIFYQTNVNPRRPYLRFYPADNIPVSKVHVKGVLPIPDLPDPCYLLQWSKEKNPLGRSDYMLSKIRLDSIYDDRSPIYGTIQIAEDGTARFVVEPPKRVEKINPSVDLKFLKQNLKEGIQGFPFETGRMDIDNSSLTFVLALPEFGSVSKAEFIERLKFFEPFFDKGLLPSEKTPLATLRYRIVSNYTQEDTISLHFTELWAKGKIKIDEDLPITIVQQTQKEFKLKNEQDVRVKYDEWKNRRDEINTVSTENNIYKRKYNHGIDIQIFYEQTKYIFKIYRVDSYVSLQRILLLLTIMLSAPKEDLSIDDNEAEQVAVLKEETTLSDLKLDSDESSDAAGSIEKALTSKGASTSKPATITQIQSAAEEKKSDEEVEFNEEPTPEKSSSENLVIKQPVKQQQVAVQSTQQQKIEQSFTANVQKYLIERLQKMDEKLFVFSVKAGEKSYVQGCQANEGKQPISLDENAYQKMINEYRDDVKNKLMDIITYDYTEGFTYLSDSRIKFKNDEEAANRVFILLKYGTDIYNLNYYFCPEYFCIRDNIVVRKDELLGTSFRKNANKELVGKRKESGHCPFCNGKVIKDIANRQPDEFVFHRRPKSKNDIKTYVNFYSKSIHPDGWILPCCGKLETPFNVQDKSPKGILMSKAFKKLKEMSATKKRIELIEKGETVEDKQIEEKEDEREDRVAPNYQDTLMRLPQQYIIKEDAVFLDVTPQKPQIGLLPTIVSDYFSQNNKTLLEKETTLTTVRPDSEGFLRVGVMNLQGRRQESFFSAIAPFLFRNSADEVRQLFKDKITVREFVSANYGNLAMEFYNPNFPKRLVPLAEIRDFATTNLEIQGLARRPDLNPYITRLYYSYLNFKGEPNKLDEGKLSFLDDKKQVKEYRQFASFLAQPGLITNRGIVFIVLEITAENKLRVVCPPFGFNKSMEKCDIGILLRQGDIWEPVFYYKTEPLIEGQKKPKHTVTLRFQRALKSSKDQPWPDILSLRVNEFQAQCSGPDVGQYTGISKVKEGAELLSLSKIIKLFVDTDKVYGVVRDTFNHIVAVLFKTDSGLIPVPVQDDGIIRAQLQIFLNWDGFEAAPADKIVEFYEKYKKPLSMFPGYKPVSLVKPKTSNSVEAIQLSSGIYIPASAPVTDRSLGLRDSEPQFIEWSLNKDIVFSFGEKKVETLKRIETDKQLEEIYEHFRLSFSDWFVNDEDGSGPNLRKEVQAIIYPTTKIFGFELPLYEKRKRLEIILGPLILKWIATTERGPGNLTNLLRVDCIGLSEKECKGACLWSTESGSCRIHAPQIKTDDNKKKNINVPLLFLYKLIEELIRFPLRRDQLLKVGNRHVSNLVDIKTAVRFGSTYIVPENSIEWSDMLRMECKRKTTEKPKFFEEMSIPPPSKSIPTKEAQFIQNIPENLESILFGEEDEPEDKFRLYTWDRSRVAPGDDLQAVLLYWTISMPELNIEKGSEQEKSIRAWKPDQWKRLISLLQKGVIYIDLDKNTVGGRRFTEPEFYVLVLEGDKVEFMIYKLNKEISTIKQKILPKSFVEDYINKLTKYEAVTK